MSRLSKAKWYAKVNLVWPDNIREIVPTPIEAIRAARKLYRFVTGRTFPARNVRLTSGNRSTDIRRGIMYVNPLGAVRDPHRGFEALVHDLSHRILNLGHGGEHARLERRMVNEAMKRGWIEGSLRDKPKPEKPKASPSTIKYVRTLAALERWGAKKRRAENALKKLNRSLKAQERAMAKRGEQPVSATVH